MDNIIVAYEAMHSMDKSFKGKFGFMALKFDISKAYDMVEWEFLHAVMTKMGFHSKWINRIMRCINSVSYSIVINGSPQTTFQVTRGIRQGTLPVYTLLQSLESLQQKLSLGMDFFVPNDSDFVPKCILGRKKNRPKVIPTTVSKKIYWRKLFKPVRIGNFVSHDWSLS